jgi:small subunit ribosomal protein S8
MATTDPIADMLTRIRNSTHAKHAQCDIPASKVKEQIAKVLKGEGFIKDYQVLNTGVQGVIRITLKYTNDREDVIGGLKRISRPGLRKYCGVADIPKIYGGMGTVIMSTPQGIMTGRKAKKQNVGGEILAYVW